MKKIFSCLSVFRVPEPSLNQLVFRMGPGIILDYHDRSRSYSLPVPIDRNYSTIDNVKKFNFRTLSDLLNN